MKKYIAQVTKHGTVLTYSFATAKERDTFAREQLSHGGVSMVCAGVLTERLYIKGNLPTDELLIRGV